MTTAPLDAGGAALRALQSIVADYGAAALSDAVFMNNVLRDLLPDEPREASVLVAAAEADVAGIIGERVAQHISPGAAIAQAATVLGERTALTQDACQWAASQTARAIGLLQAPGMDQTASVPAHMLPPPVPPPMPQPAGEPPTAPGPAGYGPPSPPGPPRPPISKTAKLAAAAVGGVVVLYLVIAAAAHLAPFSKAKSPDPAAAPASSAAQTTPPSPSSSPTPSSTPSPSPSSTQLTAAETRLFGLIPSTVQSHGTCQTDKLEFGAIAQISCRHEEGIGPAGVTYYLFSTAGRAGSAYSYFRSKFAHTTKLAGHCESFTKFVPCETTYSVGSTHTTQGRVVEYTYKGDPDMTFTAAKYKVLIDAVADKGKANSNALLKWWSKGTGHWLNGKL